MGGPGPGRKKFGQMNASLVKVPDPLPAGMRRCNYVHKELAKMWALLPKSDKEIWEKMAGLSCPLAPPPKARLTGLQAFTRVEAKHLRIVRRIWPLTLPRDAHLSMVRRPGGGSSLVALEAVPGAHLGVVLRRVVAARLPHPEAGTTRTTSYPESIVRSATDWRRSATGSNHLPPLTITIIYINKVQSRSAETAPRCLPAPAVPTAPGHPKAGA
jgi:hypothetical protein